MAERTLSGQEPPRRRVDTVERGRVPTLDAFGAGPSTGGAAETSSAGAAAGAVAAEGSTGPRLLPAWGVPPTFVPALGPAAGRGAAVSVAAAGGSLTTVSDARLLAARLVVPALDAARVPAARVA